MNYCTLLYILCCIITPISINHLLCTITLFHYVLLCCYLHALYSMHCHFIIDKFALLISLEVTQAQSLSLYFTILLPVCGLMYCTDTYHAMFFAVRSTVVRTSFPAVILLLLHTECLLRWCGAFQCGAHLISGSAHLLMFKLCNLHVCCVPQWNA